MRLGNDPPGRESCLTRRLSDGREDGATGTIFGSEELGRDRSLSTLTPIQLGVLGKSAAVRLGRAISCANLLLQALGRRHGSAIETELLLDVDPARI